MKKKYTLIYLSGLIFISFTLSGNSEIFNRKKVQYNLPHANSIATVSKDIKPFFIVYTPNVDNAFIGFREALAFKESQGKYDKINTLGYMGKYQFGESTLNRIKIFDTKAFINNPALQEKAFITLSSLNKWILQKDIEKYVSKTIEGIEITESGILAAAHLAGAGNVIKYLRSNGKIIFTDAYGSTVENYLKKFAGYDTSFIAPIKNASIQQ